MRWTYNTLNPDVETNAPAIVAVGIAFTALSLLLVVLRTYVRVFMVKAFGADDGVMVVTWFMSLGFAVVTILQSKWGLGLQHLHDMPAENVFNFGLLQYCGAPFYISSILGFKISLLLTYLRIAVERTYRNIIIGIMVACVAFHISFLLVQINLCQPISKQWDPAIVGGACLTAVPFYTSMASITILFDVIILVTPFPMLVKLQLPKRKKAVLFAVFSIGAFITVIQLIRILTIKHLSNYLDSSQLIMWSMVENNLGIIAASVPTLAPFVKAFREKSTNRSASGERGKTGSGTYALQSIGGKGMRGFVGIGSGNDGEEARRRKRAEVMEHGDLETSREELTKSPEAGVIQKTTKVVVSRQIRGDEDHFGRGVKFER